MKINIHSSLQNTGIKDLSGDAGKMISIFYHIHWRNGGYFNCYKALLVLKDLVPARD